MHPSSPQDPMGSGPNRQGPAAGATKVRRGVDPCMQIQVDLSAMLDGELDPAGVRRVTVHSDVCPQCRSFLIGVREQAGLHRRLAQVLGRSEEADGCDAGQGVAVGAHTAGAGVDANIDGAAAGDHLEAQRLRQQLTDNQRKLARVLYELGRNFTLMGLSPEFSREVAKEPMPVPDVAMRGRNLLDEMARAGEVSWVAAKELFDGRLRTPEENLARGQRLLSECLALDPEAHDARIYVGLVHYARGQRVLARRQFRRVIEECEDEIMRGFAQSNLSNIHLDEGDFDGAIELLLPLADSGVVRRQPRLLAALFNLALAYGYKGCFDSSLHWFERIWEQAPHRRRWVARELSRRSHFLHLVHTHPSARELDIVIRQWFPLDSSVAGNSNGEGR